MTQAGTRAPAGPTSARPCWRGPSPGPRGPADATRADVELGLELARLEWPGGELVCEPGAAATLLHCVSGGGHGTVERDGGTETLVFVPGTLLLDAGVRRASYRLPAMRMQLVSIRRPVPPAAWPFDDPDGLDRCCGHAGVEPGAGPLIAALWRACERRGRPGRSDALRAALGRLVERVVMGHARARLTGGPASVADARLMRAIWHVEANLGEGLEVEALAAVAGLSPYRFAHLFTAAVGTPPHRYAMRRRLERSVEALGPDGASLADVAATYGFSSQQHYTKRFGEAFGLTPGRWRAGRWRERTDGGEGPRLH